MKYVEKKYDKQINMQINMDKLINTHCEVTAYHIENLEKTKQQIENTLQQLKNHNKRGQQLMLVQANHDGVKTRRQCIKIRDLEIGLRNAYADSVKNKKFITSHCDNVKNIENIHFIEVDTICLKKQHIVGTNKKMRKIKLDQFDSGVSTIITKNKSNNKDYKDKVIDLTNITKNFKYLMPEICFAINEESVQFDPYKPFKFNKFCKVIFDICSCYDIECTIGTSRITVSNLQ